MKSQKCYNAKNRPIYFPRLSVLLLSILGCVCVVSCSESDREKINPPFLPNGEIVANKVIDLRTEPAGMTGHQQFFILWQLTSTSEKIDAATSSNLVVNSLYWLKGKSSQFDQSIQFFEACRDYAKIKPDVAKILNDVDFRYAYTQLNSSSNQVGYVSMWLCSPHAKKIVFLSAY